MMVSWTYMVFWSIYKMNKQHIKLHNRKQFDTLGKFSVDPKQLNNSNDDTCRVRDDFIWRILTKLRTK